LLVARSIWLVLAAGLFANFLLGSVAFYAQLHTVCPDLEHCTTIYQLLPVNVRVLQQLGLSVADYAAAVTGWDVAISLLMVFVGVFLFWRKSAEWYGLLVSLLLVAYGCSGIGNTLNAPQAVPPPLVLFVLLSLLAYPALGFFFVTFPNGRFWPRWTWLIALLWVVQLVEYLLPSPYTKPFWPGWLSALDSLVVFGSTAAVQFYRYRRLYTPVERQQTKWLVFGFALGALVTSFSDLFTLDSPAYLLNVVFSGLGPMAFILSLGIAILRYRLWDIDTIINKALVYGLLTGILGALYAGLIIGLESVTGLVGGTTAQNPGVLVISTLAIAALFVPVRRRIQSFIDRRFYRRKYDAEKTLAAFSASLRNEVELEHLRVHLLTVVQETMQPAHVSLWLRPLEQPRTAMPFRLEPPEPVSPHPSDGTGTALLEGQALTRSSGMQE
jgi:hypothetical protein